MNDVLYGTFETAIGHCGLVWRASPNATILKALQLPEATAEVTESRMARFPGAIRSPRIPPAIAELIERVRRHLEGNLQDFQDVTLDLDEYSAFTQQVYEAARAIPAGETRTYGSLAAAMNRPRAARAVGQALGRNPVGLIIPCHRILASGGKIGGFSAYGAQRTKKQMLAIEGIDPATFD